MTLDNLHRKNMEKQIKNIGKKSLFRRICTDLRNIGFGLWRNSSRRLWTIYEMKLRVTSSTFFTDWRLFWNAIFLCASGSDLHTIIRLCQSFDARISDFHEFVVCNLIISKRFLNNLKFTFHYLKLCSGKNEYQLHLR